MKKIASLFVRDFNNRGCSATPEVTPGCEWVINGEGVPTIKLDGTACMVRDGVLYKRYDRRPTKKAKRRGAPFAVEDFKPSPDGFEPCEANPDGVTGHWPGWVPVGDGPEDKWFRAATMPEDDGTYELVGPKVQGNPYGMTSHVLQRHGSVKTTLNVDPVDPFVSVRLHVEHNIEEGVVWHHPDGRMCKVKRSDFGLKWPV